MASALLGACSTTSVATSVDLTKEAAPPGAYIQYALPQTVLVATITEVGDGDGGGAKPDKAAPASPAIVNNVYAAAPTPAKEDPKPAKPDPKAKVAKAPAKAPAGKAPAAKPAVQPAADAAAKGDETPAKLPLDCKVQKSDYLRLSTANKDFIDAEKAFLRRLKGLIKFDPDLSKPALILRTDVPEANRLMDKIKADRVQAEGRDPIAAQTLADYTKNCAKPLKIDVTTEVAADTSHVYALVIKDDANSADKLTAKPDENGLLTSLTTTADEKSGEIAVAAVKSLVSFAYLVDPAALVPAAALQTMAPAVATVVASAPTENNHTYSYVPGKPKPKPKPKPEPPKLVPAAAYLEFIEEAENRKPVHAYPDLPRAYPKAPVGPLRFGVSDKPTILLDTFSIEVKCSTPKAKGMTIPPESNGVLVSSLVPCQLTTKLKEARDQGQDPPARTAYFSAWDPSVPVALPLNRTALVPRTTTYAFSQGRQTSADYDKPSDGLAAATLPGTIILGAISGLSSAIQGRQSVTDAETARIKARASLYDAQAGLYDSQVKAMTAKAGLEKAAGTAP